MVYQLHLKCTSLKGGDWVGTPLSDEEEEVEYILPDTEEEWFAWEKKKAEARAMRKAKRMASEGMDKVGQWQAGLQEVSLLEPPVEAGFSQPYYPVEPPIGMGERDLRLPSSSQGFEREMMEPVDHHPTSPPPAPLVEAASSFAQSLSSAPYLPSDIQGQPSFNLGSQNISTPKSKAPQQLSSPISPPRLTLEAVTVSQPSYPVSSKRLRGNSEDESQDKSEGFSTPRAKRAKKQVEPITPKSVERPSQEVRRSQPDHRTLPTLTQLLVSSSKSRKSRKSSSGSPLSGASFKSGDWACSEPMYSKFLPQFESTQRRHSEPVSPGDVRESSSVDSQQNLPSSSSGMYFQSQFPVERRLEHVAAFLRDDLD
ncbi:hypothetical protein M422DRAFT_783688 [Sphaerobolus stellatus SS14]|uniref:Uncharacterized protein n=1 Tax=Sphaerobolus stellatus (strain SS14) TaxID=990650 RepID=A0A0C9V2V8_SPHS4|nr:hypothetical protein M422DRAFT_783688 [Sphaerobolus stellatus SS14]